MDEPTITITLNPNQMIDIINDYECRVGEYQDEDGCPLDCQITDPIVLAFARDLQPCLCSDRTKAARATVQYLREQFKQQAPKDYHEYFRT